jgi:TPR repeat protein
VDLSKAEELLDRAARLGIHEAVLQKARIWHERGDWSRYFAGIQQAAGMGMLAGKYRLGQCYARGIGTASDTGKAFEIMRDAAGRGHVGAKIYLARRLLARPVNPLGFLRGLGAMVAALGEALRIAVRDYQDERIR